MRHYEGKGSYYEKFEAIMKNNGIIPEDYKIVFYRAWIKDFDGEMVEYGLIAKGFRKPYAHYTVYYDSMRHRIDMKTCRLEYEDKEVIKRMEAATWRKACKLVQAEMEAEMAN